MLKELPKYEGKKSPLEQLPQHFIDSVLAATNIENVVGGVVELKRSGNNLFGLCPFHGEKSPSFSVAPAKQIYHCFGCGMNGDAISFLREHAALSFREAVIELAEMARIPVPSSTPGEAAVQHDLGAMLKANDLAAKFFRHCLKHTDAAKDYLKKRRITPEAAKRFVVGYAPQGWQSLEEAFPDYKTNKHLVDLGLTINKEGRIYDRFRDRLIFGIRDARGRIVGFGGRSMDGSEPKYLNSPASPLFDKSSQLFGIFEAREKIRSAKRVIVTEGYIDTIANSMAGLEETVATMGTACTEYHLERLCALAPEVIFSFDGDKAGQAAAWKSLKTCLPFASDNRTFRFLILPEGKDPDELVESIGAEAYKTVVESAKSLSTFMLEKLAEDNAGLATAENKAKFMAEGQGLINLLPEGNLRRILRAELVKASSMTPEEIRAISSQPRPEAKINRNSPWATITQAVRDQAKTAASLAEPIIGLLDPALQDAFFESRISAFPESQQAFWRAMDEAILHDDPQDAESPIAQAQRDLIQQGPSIVGRLLRQEAAAQLRQSFREGAVSEEALIEGISRRERPAQP